MKRTVVEHLVACLVEEAGEVAQTVGKAERFGFDDKRLGSEASSTPNNRQRIGQEARDFVTVYNMIRDYDPGFIPIGVGAKHPMKELKVLGLMFYAFMCGTLDFDQSLHVSSFDEALRLTQESIAEGWQAAYSEIDAVTAHKAGLIYVGMTHEKLGYRKITWDPKDGAPTYSD